MPDGFQTEYMPRYLKILFRSALVVCLAFTGVQPCQGEDEAKKPIIGSSTPRQSQILVKVNGEAITESDLQRAVLLKGIPEHLREKVRDQILGQLIDARLMRSYLKTQKLKVPEAEIDTQIQRMEVMLQSRPDSKQILQNLHENRRVFREEISLPMMWQSYSHKLITDEQMQAYYNEHRQELDGTKLRVSHVLLKAPVGTSDADSNRMEQELVEMREEIVSGKTTFAEAARAKSQAPSSAQGGEIGLIEWDGVMPESFCQIAYSLPVGEVSKPFRTHFGWHLCVVSERVPGELSVEDVRKELRSRISQQLWNQKLSELRSEAKIEPITQ